MGSNNSKTGIEKSKAMMKSNLQPLTIDENYPPIIDEADPRSPTFCRTPLNEIAVRNQVAVKVKETPQNNTPYSKAKLYQNPSEILKYKLLKEVQQNMIDPRSPSDFINRTPIVLNDSSLLTVSTDVSLIENDQVVDLNDSFSNLEIFNKASSANTDETNDASNNVSEENFSAMNANIGVESTPVKKSPTNDTKNEDIMMEDFSNVTSLKENVPNKQIDRVKGTVLSSQKKTIIYQDDVIENTTPVKRSGRTPTRTPLSCLANKTHYRSKSVENLEDSPKAKIRPLCFDDNNIDSRQILKKCSNRSPAYDYFKRRQDSKVTKMHLLRKV